MAINQEKSRAAVRVAHQYAPFIAQFRLPLNANELCVYKNILMLFGKTSTAWGAGIIKSTFVMWTDNIKYMPVHIYIYTARYIEQQQQQSHILYKAVVVYSHFLPAHLGGDGVSSIRNGLISIRIESPSGSHRLRPNSQWHQQSQDK